MRLALGIAFVATVISVPALATGLGGRAAVTAASKKHTRHADAAADLAQIKKEAARLRGPKGDHGAPGAAGPAGATGPQGPPGPTASGAASNTPGTTPLTSSDLAVLSLGGPGGTGPIRPPFSGRLLVNASADFRKTDSAGFSSVDCFLVMSTNGAPLASGGPGVVAISQTVDRSLSAQFEEESIAVVGSAPVVAGNAYDVTLVCQSFNLAVDYGRGNMTALVAGG